MQRIRVWYLGDLEAISKAYPKFKFKSYVSRAKFRKPDLLNASDELSKILPDFQKISTAKLVSPHLSLNVDENKSESFRYTILGIIKFFNEIET